MFTGIIESIGKVQAMQDKGGDLRLTLNTGKLDMSDVALGDSIAVNGVCLTVIDMTSNSFAADVSRETLRLTSLGKLRQGSPVNLEKALTLQTSLTVNAVNGNEFELNIVPHTLQETIMGGYQAGTEVNLEVDIIGRYLERLLLGEQAAEKGAKGKGVDMDLLRKAGFVS